MGMPNAARKGADRAVELIKQARESAAPAPGKPSAAPAPASAAAPAPAPDVDALRAEVARLKSANDVLQGKYNAEVPRQATELREAKEALAAAEAKLAAVAPPAPLSSLTEEERLQMGEGTITVMQKVVREMFEPEFASRLKPINESLEYLKGMTAQQYMHVIEFRVPDFAAQNEDPAFFAWLQQLDPATQRLRQTLLDDAHTKMQGNRVVDIFLAYREKREIGAAPSRQQSPSPGREAAGDPPPNPQPQAGNGRSWTRAEIQQFYQREKRTMTPEAAAETERDIFAAYREGRVRG